MADQTENRGLEITQKSPSYDDASDTEFPLRRICAAWEAKLKLAKTKREPWKKVSDECLAFYSKSYDFMWDARVPDAMRLWTGKLAPKFRITINKAFELVALYGPVMYAKNPVRTVTPRDTVAVVTNDLLGSLGIGPLPPPPQPDPQTGFTQPEPPQIQQFRELVAKNEQRTARGKVQSKLMELYLNYIVKEGPGGGFKPQMQMSVAEALIKGRGLMWPEIWTPPGTNRVQISSVFDDTYNWFIDADATLLQNAQVVYRECIHPAWQLEREYKLPPGSIPPNYESHDAQASTEADDLGNMHRAMGQTSDLVRYYKVYSNMGLGGRLHGLDGGVRKSLEALGDHCFLVICPGVPYPLNLPPKSLNASIAEVKKRVAWPIPYWRDGLWPCANLDFYHDPGTPYVVPPLQPGLGELKFMTLMMSHLTNRIWSSCRNIAWALKGVEEQLRTALESGNDLEVVSVGTAQMQDVKQVLGFLEFPQLNKDVWTILEANAINFDKRVGLTELMYGMSANQMRSAQEAAVKEDRINVRPDYMANKVEDFLSMVARMEALATRWCVEDDDVKPIFGDFGAGLWKSHIMSTPVEEVAAEMEYSVESGSARKQNKEQDIANIQEMMGVTVPILTKYSEITSDTEPLNAFLQQWGKSIGKKDMEQIKLGPMAPPPSDAPSPEQQKIELEKTKAEMTLQTKQQEMQMKAEESQQQMAFEREKHEQEMAMEREKFQMEMQMEQQKAAIGMQVAQQEAATDIQVAQTQASAQMQIDQQKGDQQLQLGQQKASQQAQQHHQQMQQTKQAGDLDIKQQKQSGEIKTQQAKQVGDVKLHQTKEQGKIKAEAAKQQAKAKAQEVKKKKPKK